MRGGGEGIALVVACACAAACASEPPKPAAPVATVAPAASDAPAAPAPAAPSASIAPVRCNAPAWQTALLPGCQAIPSDAVRASWGGTDATSAVDRSTCTYAGADPNGPRALTLDLGEPRDVGHVILVPFMDLRAAVSHVIEVSDDGATFDPRARYDGEMFSGGVFGITLTPAAHARYVRVRTLGTPPLTGWFEVVPVVCPGESAVAPRANPPPLPAPSATAPAPAPSASGAPHRTRLLPRIAPPPWSACTADAECILIYTGGRCPPCGATPHDQIAAVNEKVLASRGAPPGTGATGGGCPDCLSGFDCAVAARCVAGTCRVREDLDATPARRGGICDPR